MNFKADVESTPGLESAYREGLKALGTKAKYVRVVDTRRLSGSVDLDAALRIKYPHSPRWDYVVAIEKQGATQLCMIEIHDANSHGAVRSIVNKRDWLVSWLETDGEVLLKYRRELVWIASGPSSFHRGSPQAKRLAQKGVKFVGHRLVL